MNDDKMMQPLNGQNVPMLTGEQVLTLFGQYETLMREVIGMMNRMNERIDRLDKQMQQLTPITGTQERAIGERIKQRAEELREVYKLPEECRTAIASAIRKDIKATGGVRAIRELPRVDYPVYIDQIALWDNFAMMREMRRNCRK